MFTMFKALVNRRRFDDQVLYDVLHALLNILEDSSGPEKCVAFFCGHTSPITKQQFDLIKEFLVKNSIDAYIVYKFRYGSHRAIKLDSNTEFSDNASCIKFELSKTDLIKKINEQLSFNDSVFRSTLSGVETDWTSPSGQYYA
ncbi:MAG: hypothetical protein NTZ86_09475 [Legionellales bacterium]|nr:hypothetical protein [Legionellales bacterium]